MMKYDFILLSSTYQEFIERVRELGLVDITTTGWQSSEQERDLILAIEAHTKAETALKAFAQSESMNHQSEAIGSAKEAFEIYTQTKLQAAQLTAQIATLEKSADELLPWGEFSPSDIEALEARGVVLHLFTTIDSNYENNIEEWASLYTIEKIASQGGFSYFVVVTTSDEPISLDAQEVKRPTMSAQETSAEIEKLYSQLRGLDSDFSRCAKSCDLIARERLSLTEELQSSKVQSTATAAAEGSLMVMEAWAEESTAAKVDALLEEFTGVVYLKEAPTPEDNTPVKLHNKWFASIFELVGNMYSLPKYGTVDLTPLFAPFYMLFFAICLCDAGYGLVIALAGVALLLKGGESMKQASYLTMICGSAAVAFGVYANSVFGMQISSVPLFSDVPFLNFQKDFFAASMVIGVVQILFGMMINIVVTSRTFGVKYALGSIGWFSLLVSSILSFGLTSMGVDGFGFSSIAYMVVAGASAVLMLCFNSPDNNIFANIGPGLWNTYNNITGLLGDVLSYIRLFAIGLSGGVLAIVFNSLAIGMTGLDTDLSGQSIVSIAIKVVFASIILLFGHGINLFMSTISSAVHPMRLTFVEFFKNAGFEMATREFNPLKKEK